MSHTNNDYFKMGAVVAVGELYGQGMLESSEEMAEEIRSFLGSFGVNDLDDMRALGMGDVYLSNFKNVYECA